MSPAVGRFYSDVGPNGPIAASYMYLANAKASWLSQIVGYRNFQADRGGRRVVRFFSVGVAAF